MPDGSEQQFLGMFGVVFDVWTSVRQPGPEDGDSSDRVSPVRRPTPRDLFAVKNDSDASRPSTPWGHRGNQAGLFVVQRSVKTHKFVSECACVCERAKDQAHLAAPSRQNSGSLATL